MVNFILQGNWQGLCRSWKTWKVLEFYSGIFKNLEVLGKGHSLVLESSGNLFNSTNKYMRCMEDSNQNLGSVGVKVNFRAFEKSMCPGNLFLKMGANPGFGYCTLIMTPVKVYSFHLQGFI